MKTNSLKTAAAALADRTADAFSFDNYGDRRWAACAAMLLRRGYTPTEAEVILRSKWTRWAGDVANKAERVNSADLARFLDTMSPEQRAHDVAEMVRETFPDDDDVVVAPLTLVTRPPAATLVHVELSGKQTLVLDFAVPLADGNTAKVLRRLRADSPRDADVVAATLRILIARQETR
jgi:hypothetical protein